MLRNSLALARLELRLLRGNLWMLVVPLGLPLAILWLTQAQYRLVLIGQGFADANGSEQAVPGMCVMAAQFLVGFVGLTFFRDHGWGTWDRLRASPLGRAEIMVGKILPTLAIGAVQQTLLLAIGVGLFGLRVRGPLLALALVSAALLLCVLSFGVALTAVCKTLGQLATFHSLGNIVLTGVAGALVPVGLLPPWVAIVAPATPGYWAMRGFQSVVFGAPDLGLSLIVLLLFSLGFASVAALRFRFEDTKTGWS